MGSEAGNTRLRSARQALGLRSQQQLAGRGHTRRELHRPSRLDNRPHRAPLGIRRPAMAAA